jgi:hypothetical protein
VDLPLIVTAAIAILALLLAGYLAWRLSVLQERVEGALGTGEGDLEENLNQYHDRVEEVDARLAELTDEYTRLAGAQGLSSQKISLVRFNPFGDTGGDQSFSLAVLDAHDSGYVLTSIHGRQGTRVYVKPIDFGDSKYPLSDEERQALNQAKKRTADVK